MEIQKIGCTVEKSNPINKTELKSKFIRLEECGLNVAHTITTHEPNLCVQHANMVIQINKLTEVLHGNTILEQSRAEQSSLMYAA